MSIPRLAEKAIKGTAMDAAKVASSRPKTVGEIIEELKPQTSYEGNVSPSEEDMPKLEAIQLQ